MVMQAHGRYLRTALPCSLTPLLASSDCCRNVHDGQELGHPGGNPPSVKAERLPGGQVRTWSGEHGIKPGGRAAWLPGQAQRHPAVQQEARVNACKDQWEGLGL